MPENPYKSTAITKAIIANTTSAISGMGNCWKVAEPTDLPSTVQERPVLLEIQGDEKNGYHLVMSPEGCFTADTWHKTRQEAIDVAMSLFGVRDSEWRTKEP